MTKREKVLTSITSVSLAIAIATSSVLCYHIAWNQGRFHPFHYKPEDSVKEMIRAGPKKGAQNQPCQPRSFQGTSEKEEKIQAESSTVSPWVSRK